MDRLVRLTVPSYIYRFYQQASTRVANSSAEDIMSDALCAYAGLLSEEVAKKREDTFKESTSSSRSL